MRKILFVTERRADYSRFKPIIDKIIQDPDLDYYLIVTGIHLLEEYGRSIDLIKKDGLRIDSVIPMFADDHGDTGRHMVQATARFMERIAEELERLKPDMVLAGFDIGANFGVAVAAAHMNIPVGHVQGGEVSGSIDESLRHAISKFAHFHFPANKDAADRLVRMGEDPQYVFPVGCPSIDALLSARDIASDQLKQELGGFDTSKPFILIIQHTVTTEAGEVSGQIEETIQALKELDVPALLLYPNNDAGGRSIVQAIEGTPIHRVRTLSYEVFANVLKRAGVLVGNSSTGIHEAATFRIPVVNIGNRQQGRMRPENVIDVANDRREIGEAVNRALTDRAFLEKVQTCDNPYGDGKSAARIVKVLKEIPLNDSLIKKKFVD
ncbi:MAG: UDP-N-acetylglucosamine 2-epimerase (hydrolyzing) [Parcubacteria group bacterium]|nr:UDP-N-acetylglucosamine 2-epimerase (hydrolyzing) [Parcubacteria group bacterium]